MPRRKQSSHTPPAPKPAWAVYLRTSGDENQKPELSRARQRFAIQKNVLERSELPVFDEYIDVFSGKNPNRQGYQRLLQDARDGKFSHVIVERADRFGRNDTEALRAIDELHEYGVAVRFANSPDLDPIDPDDRVVVTLSFTLARRETALLAIRVKGGLKAKRESGGWCGQAPDGYRNVQERTSVDEKHQFGRFTRRIELDPERAKLWLEAWSLLLEDKYTLQEIAETLHAKGYQRMRGGSFVTVTKTGKRVPHISTLSNTFHNWAYAGWVVSKENGILPKTVRGNWEPLISGEDFERGLAILDRRVEHRTYKRTQDYLLTGMIYHRSRDGKETRLSGSTSNAGRTSGGTAYYRVAAAGSVSFQCIHVDHAVAKALKRIQIDPALLPLIRASYTQELGEVLGLVRPDERAKLRAILSEIDAEEMRMARMLASGKISEKTWDELWSEWRDRRQQIGRTLYSMETQQSQHIQNLEDALKIIAVVGNLYNGLQRSDQKELLRCMVERVIVDDDGKVKLKLRTPFAYLHNLTEEVQMAKARQKRGESKSGGKPPTTPDGDCSNALHVC